MKKIFIIFCIISLNSKAYTQDYTPMFEIGKIWNMYLQYDYPDGYYFNLTVTETVEIDGLTYYHIEASHNNCETFLREDIDQKKIYGIWEGEEYLHYDFSLDIGDYIWYLGFPILITNIEYGDFYGIENLRYFVLENNFKLIESIGFESIGIADSFEYGCLHHPIYETIHLENMNQPLSVDDVSLGNITIYPNPVQGILILDNPSTIEMTSISIYDLLGRLVLVHEGYEQIDVSHLNSGLLFVEIETDQGILTKKIIKE